MHLCYALKQISPAGLRLLLISGAEIGQVIATDEDYSEEFNTVVYTLESANDRFEIVKESGVIYVS